MNQFPYTNFHEINLDWIVKKLSKIAPMVLTWEGTNTVIEDPDNPGNYILQTTFPDGYDHLNAFKNGATITLHIPAYDPVPEVWVRMEGVSYGIDTEVYAGGATLYFDPTTNTVINSQNL